MQWERLEKALTDGFCELTGLSANWQHDKSIALCPPYGLLNMSAMNQIGEDEVRYEEVVGAPTGKEICVTICGIRQFTWSMQVESDSFAPGKAAWYYLETARTKLRSARFCALMEAVGVSRVSTGAVQKLDYTRDGRWVSRALLDVVFQGVVAIKDCPVTYIESAKVSSDVLRPDGTEAAASLDFENRVMP